ncbi:microtubule-associated protein futsch-like [Prorops nasuta]|uniref:microtubule-associated protein futsch-like n=1 Tax=Prorops nasuta TaxID=863751 RepID=UPI0034CDD504
MKESWCIINLSIIIFLSASSASGDVILNINIKKPVAVLSDKFLSLTIDYASLFNSGSSLSSNLKKSENLIKALSPGYIRFGGPSSNSFIFQRTSRKYQGKRTDNSISEEQWTDLYEWTQKAGLDVIACIAPRFTGNDTHVQSWDSRNAVDFISFSNHLGYNVNWQLGYECQTRCNASGLQMGKYVRRLRNILSGFPRYSNSMISGPDVVVYTTKRQQEYLENYLNVAGSALSAITWHPNLAGISFSKEGVSMHHDNLAENKDELFNTIGQWMDRKQLWIAESKAEKCKGQFLGALVWARRLGNAAKLGVPVMMRQPADLFKATPDYWVSLLHKTLVGREVLDAKVYTTNESYVYFYAHCTRPSENYEKGSVTIFGVNLSPGRTVAELKGVKAKTLHKYILLPGFDAPNRMFAETTLLNNEPLNLINNELPDIEPIITVNKKNPRLKLPSGGIGFWVLPNVRVKSCMLDDTSENGSVKRQLTNEEINDIRQNMNEERWKKQEEKVLNLFTEEAARKEAMFARGKGLSEMRFVHRNKRQLDSSIFDNTFSFKKEAIKRRAKSEKIKRKEILPVRVDLKNGDSEENNFYGFPRREPIKNFPKGDVFLDTGNSTEDADYDYVKEEQSLRDNETTTKQTPEDPEFDDTLSEAANEQFAHVPNEFFEKVKLSATNTRNNNLKNYSELWEADSLGETSNTCKEETKEQQGQAKEIEATVQTTPKPKTSNNNIHTDDENSPKGEVVQVYYERPVFKSPRQFSTRFTNPIKVPVPKKILPEDFALRFKSKKLNDLRITEDPISDFSDLEVQGQPRAIKRETLNQIDSILNLEMVKEDESNSKICNCRNIKNPLVKNACHCREKRIPRSLSDSTGTTESTDSSDQPRSDSDAKKTTKTRLRSRKTSKSRKLTDTESSTLSTDEILEMAEGTNFTTETATTEAEETKKVGKEYFLERKNEIPEEYKTEANTENFKITEKNIDSSTITVPDTKEKEAAGDVEENIKSDSAVPSEGASSKEEKGAKEENLEIREKLEEVDAPTTIKETVLSENESSKSGKRYVKVKARKKSEETAEDHAKALEEKYAARAEALIALQKENENRRMKRLMDVSSKIVGSVSNKHQHQQSKLEKQLEILKEQLNSKREKLARVFKDEIGPANNFGRRKRESDGIEDKDEFVDLADREKLKYILLNKPINYSLLPSMETIDSQKSKRYAADVEIERPLHRVRERKIFPRASTQSFTDSSLLQYSEPSAPKKRMVEIQDNGGRDNSQSEPHHTYYAIVEDVDNPRIYRYQGDSSRKIGNLRSGVLQSSKLIPIDIAQRQQVYQNIQEEPENVEDDEIIRHLSDGERESEQPRRIYAIDASSYRGGDPVLQLHDDDEIAITDEEEVAYPEGPINTYPSESDPRQEEPREIIEQSDMLQYRNLNVPQPVQLLQSTDVAANQQQQQENTNAPVYYVINPKSEENLQGPVSYENVQRVVPEQLENQAVAEQETQYIQQGETLEIPVYRNILSSENSNVEPEQQNGRIAYVLNEQRNKNIPEEQEDQQLYVQNRNIQSPVVLQQDSRQDPYYRKLGEVGTSAGLYRTVKIVPQTIQKNINLPVSYSQQQSILQRPNVLRSNVQGQRRPVVWRKPGRAYQVPLGNNNDRGVYAVYNSGRQGALRNVARYPTRSNENSAAWKRLANIRALEEISSAGHERQLGPNGQFVYLLSKRQNELNNNTFDQHHENLNSTVEAKNTSSESDPVEVDAVSEDPSKIEVTNVMSLHNETEINNNDNSTNQFKDSIIKNLQTDALVAEKSVISNANESPKSIVEETQEVDTKNARAEIIPKGNERSNVFLSSSGRTVANYNLNRKSGYPYTGGSQPYYQNMEMARVRSRREVFTEEANRIQTTSSMSSKKKHRKILDYEEGKKFSSPKYARLTKKTERNNAIRKRREIEMTTDDVNRQLRLMTNELSPKLGNAKPFTAEGKNNVWKASNDIIREPVADETFTEKNRDLKATLLENPEMTPAEDENFISLEEYNKNGIDNLFIKFHDKNSITEEMENDNSIHKSNSYLEKNLPKLQSVITEGIVKVQNISESVEGFVNDEFSNDFGENSNQTMRVKDKNLLQTHSIFINALDHVNKFFSLFPRIIRIIQG